MPSCEKSCPGSPRTSLLRIPALVTCSDDSCGLLGWIMLLPSVGAQRFARPLHRCVMCGKDAGACVLLVLTPKPLSDSSWSPLQEPVVLFLDQGRPVYKGVYEHILRCWSVTGCASMHWRRTLLSKLFCNDVYLTDAFLPTPVLFSSPPSLCFTAPPSLCFVWDVSFVFLFGCRIRVFFASVGDFSRRISCPKKTIGLGLEPFALPFPPIASPETDNNRGQCNSHTVLTIQRRTLEATTVTSECIRCGVWRRFSVFLVGVTHLLDRPAVEVLVFFLACLSLLGDLDPDLCLC
mmetsp:Transcript_33917/g.78220  ORF Transcript_33917/g.78220 Transcript_33917/m.78220 type:complete len:292 (+) Transcript_33917:93-968(+)